MQLWQHVRLTVGERCFLVVWKMLTSVEQGFHRTALESWRGSCRQLIWVESQT